MTELPVAIGRTPIAHYDTYLEAQRAVDFLSDRKFPVEHLSIIGSDLYMVETVLGRLNWWRAALAGAGSGAWFGLLIGLLFGLFATTAGSFFALTTWGILFGAVFGAVFGLVAYLMTRGKRDFVSQSRIVPRHFTVVADAQVVDQARSLLSELP